MDDGVAPLIGITTAWAEGAELRALPAGVAVCLVDAALGFALERAGAVPVLLPPTRSPAVVERYLAMVDGLLFSGGDGYLWRQRRPRTRLPDLPDLSPWRWAFEAVLLQGALARDLPVLGICRGHQLIARVMSGPCLVQLDPDGSVPSSHAADRDPLGRHPVHDIRIEAGSLLHTLIGTDRIGVNSLHRQAVVAVQAPLFISARAEDGVVEAVESRAHRFVLGVQFHPELLLDAAPAWPRLFAAFVAACRETRNERSRSAPAAAPLA